MYVCVCVLLVLATADKLEQRTRARNLASNLRSVADGLARLTSEWEVESRPRLEADAWAIWESARQVVEATVLGQSLGGTRAGCGTHRELWQWDVAYGVERLWELVQELLNTYRGASGSLREGHGRCVTHKHTE